MEPHGVCAFFGSMKPLWMNAQTAWACASAVYLFRVLLSPMRGLPTFGPRDIYLHGFCWGIPFISWLIGWSVNAYGVEYAYCGVVNPKTDLYLIFIPMFSTIIFLAVTYGIIVYKMNKSLRRMQDHSDESKIIKQKIEKMRSVVKSIGLYPFAYLLQWLPKGILKLELFSVQGNTGFIYLMFVVICANSGGFFNCLLYGPLLWNQIKREKRKETRDMMSNAIVVVTPKSEENQVIEFTMEYTTNDSDDGTELDKIKKIPRKHND